MAPNIYTIGVTLMLVSSTLAYLGTDYESPIRNFPDSSYPHPRILLLGGTGTGKSSVGNVLLGRKAHDKPEEFASRRCFHAGKGNDAVTIESCADRGKWMGTGEEVTIIDTPGFGDATPEKDGNTTEFLINMLKTDIKFIDAFVFFFNGKSARFTWSMRSMLKQFENMFGTDFWNNVIFEVTFWSYADSNIRIRKLNDETEESFTAGRNKKFKEEFGVKEDIPSVFIHPLYNENDEYETSQFKNNTEKLFKFAKEKTPFACNDIKAVLAEIQEYMREKKQLEEDNAKLRNDIKGMECDPCDVPEPVKPLPQKGMNKMQVAGLGFGMVILGLLIGVAITFFLKSQDNMDDTPTAAYSKDQEVSEVLTSTGEEE